MKSRPHARFLAVAVISVTVLTPLLHLRMHEWFGSAHLAFVIVFETTILAFAIRSLVRWIIERRRPDDDFPGNQRDYGLAA